MTMNTWCSSFSLLVCMIAISCDGYVVFKLLDAQHSQSIAIMQRCTAFVPASTRHSALRIHVHEHSINYSIRSVERFTCVPSAADMTASLDRRAVMSRVIPFAGVLAFGLDVHQAEGVEQVSQSGKQEPTEKQTNVIRNAFKAYDNKQLESADRLFSEGIATWEGLNRPRDEMATLYKTRGNVRVDLKRFVEAKEDYDKTIDLMKSDGETPSGTAVYPEYPDAFVQRGLSYEGLGQWTEAVNDYTRAIKLWGGGRGDDVNPYVLTFRANALTRLSRWPESIDDYAAAEASFLKMRDSERALDARANRALVLYETGEKDQAVKIMREIVRRRPGYADMHAALAAHLWAKGDSEEAETQWEFMCNNISVGCKFYKDLNWVSTVRRWPPSLVENLKRFLGKVEK